MNENRIKTMAGVIAFAGGLLATGVALASEAEISSIESVYAVPSAAEPRFSDRFLHTVPFAQIESAIDGLRERYGPALAVREVGEGYEIETATHRLPVQITLGGDGKIEGLLFKPAERLTASVEETLQLIEDLPGSVSYVVTRDGEPAYGRDASERQAVGSAFKLAVLKVLADKVATGERHWDDIMHLQEGDRSLPSGRLQSYPSGSPFTLHTLAAAMIAESDNTATDMLIRLLGRKEVAAALGEKALLTTREFFMLKSDRDLASRWASADDRGTLMDEIAGRELPDASKAGGHHVTGVEWYVSNETLCELVDAVSGLDVFSINPGPVDRANWQSVAYKGGSEPGVLNLTAALIAHDGTRHCVSVTVNDDQPVDTVELTGLFSRLTTQLAASDGAG